METKRYSQVAFKCPHCGREYTLAEVYMPGDLIGKPCDVVRDPLGKVLYADWEEEPAREQRYECDQCGKAFIVSAEVRAVASAEPDELDFSDSSEAESLF